MKIKSYLSIVIAAFAMFLAQAEIGHQHCICGTGACAVSGHEHTSVEWTAWEATDTLPTTAGYWYLTNDVVLASTYAPVDGVKLCLNGHSVRPSDPAQLIVEIKDGVTMAVTDCGTAVHYFTDEDYDKCYETVSDEPTEGAIALTGGYITGCRYVNAERTAIGIDGGTMEFYAGNIVGNYSGITYGQNGGAVNVGGDGARLTMFGGEIAGNRTHRGGAVNVNNGGKAILAGGRVHHNAAEFGGALYMEYHASVELNGTDIDCNSAGSDSGAVYADGNPEIAFSKLTMTAGCIHHNEPGGIALLGDFTMTGGTVCSNRLGNGVSVFQKDGARLTLGGSARIFDNVNDNGKSNLRLYSDDMEVQYPKVEFSTDVPPVGSGNFGLSAAALVNPGDAYAFATNKVESQLQYFTVDDPMTRVRYEDGNLIIYRLGTVNVNVEAGENSGVEGVYVNGAKIESWTSSYEVTEDSTVDVVFEAYGDAVFTNGLATITNTVVATGEETSVYGPDAATPTRVNFFAQKGGAEPTLVLSNAVTGGMFVFPEPPASMERPGYDFTGWRASFDWWMGETHYDVGDESPELWYSSYDVYADWSLRITQQPNATNDYTVLVAVTDALEYRWYRWNEGSEEWDEVPCMATNRLIAGRNGETYKCTIMYDDGEKTADTESVVWEEPDTLVEVRPVAGANVMVGGVYTNEVAVVPVGGKYYVFYGEEVGVDFAANEGYLFPTALEGENFTFAATVDPTVVASASAYQPHACHDMNLVVPIGDLETFYLVCSNSYAGYLTADLTVDHDIALGLVQLTHPQICMNGHVLDLNGYAFLQTGISAYFCDCQHDVARYYEADEDGLWHLVETPSATSHRLDGGVIIGGSAGENLGVFDNGVVTLTFLDVNVVGNDGGEGAVVYSSCKTRFIGGALCGNRADKGVLYEAQEYDCWCRVGGRVHISNNVTTLGKDKPCNLLVRDGGTIRLDPDMPLATNATIGVTAEYGPITEELPKDYSPCFTPDHDGDVITNRANNQLFLLGPAATVTFDANGGTGAPAAIATLRVGEVLMLPAAGGMTRTGYAFEGWMLDGELKAVGDKIKITGETMTLVADWTLVIAQQPTYANGYVVGVGTTDTIGYQWYKRGATPINEISDTDISATQGSYDESTNTFTPDEYWATCCIHFGTGRSTGDVFTFKSTYGDYSQTGLTIVGQSGEYTLYQYILLESEKDWWDEWELNLSGSAAPILDAALVSFSTLDEETGAQLTTGENGTEYFCRLTYEGGEKTVDTNRAIWYETHDPVTVTAGEGANATLDGVYTNGVKLVKEGDHYIVTYSEVVVAVFEAEAGYVFPDGTTVFTNVVMALENPTTIAGEKAYLPHVHCLCGDGACAVSGHAHQDLMWQPWTATDALPTEAGNWYLTEDVTLNDTTTLDAVNIRLCLNGHTVHQGADPDEQQTIVRLDDTSCRFSLTDCADAATPGILTEGANGAVVVGAGVFDLWHGLLAGNTSSGNGGAVLVDRGWDACFRMYGGTICGNTASGSGGGVYVEAETHAEFYGGAITNNVAGSVGGGVFCLNWIGSYVSDVVIGGALVVTDNRRGGKTDNLHCMRGEIAFSADIPLTDAARVGISYTGEDTTSVATQVFAKAYGTDCTAHLFSDDPFAYVAYNGEQRHELRTRVLAQPTAANGYTFELYTNGLAAGSVTYQWNTNAVGTVALADDDYYVYLGNQEGDVCTAYEGVENYCLNVEFYKGEVIFEFVGDIPDDLVWDYCTTNAIDATHVRVTFDSEDYGNSILTATSSFSVRFLTETQVPVPLEGETAASIVSREEGLTTYCRATIDGQTRDSDRVTVGGLDSAASVTGNGVTKYFPTLEEAWTNAVSSEYDMTNVVVRMLKDATVTETLRRTVVGFIGYVLTLDLNNHVLAYAGENDACVVEQAAGQALEIVDTATTRTRRYFACDEGTGLWTLTDAQTGPFVEGGVITGGRAGAVSVTYGNKTNVFRNVNIVGNRNDGDGGAVSVSYGTLAVSNSTFLGNVSSANGGAISSSVPCLMTDCRVESNVAAENGGGLYLKGNGSLVRTEVVGNRAGTGGGVYLTKKLPTCLPAGTRILMADGTEKDIEQIAVGDVVATFDHLEGMNSSAAVFYVYGGEDAEDVFTLSFASGATLGIAGCHDLLLETTRKYVTVSSENVRSYLGKRFYNAARGEWDELVGVEAEKDGCAYYSIYTRGHGNCVANGMLTVPDDKDCFVNVYELDENLKADADRLAADIAAYGLAKPADYPNIPLDDFVDGNIRYAFIAIAKGLTTQEELLFWNEYDYGPVVAKKAASAPKRMMSAPLMTFGSSAPIPAPSAPCLSVGENVVVTGNVSTAGSARNVFLDRGKNAVIDILGDADGIDVGVTLSTGADVFGWTNEVNYATSFFADDPAYTVTYTADRVLALRTGIRVGDDAWATVEDGTCTIIGTGAMWNHDEWTAGNPLAAYRTGIRSVVVGDGVTAIGSQFFHKFYALTNLACAASVTAVGDHAFYRCFSLQTMDFAAQPTFGDQAYSMHAEIVMDGSVPRVYAIPAIAIAGMERHLMGKVALTDAEWTDVTALGDDELKAYHFFKIEMR